MGEVRDAMMLLELEGFGEVEPRRPQEAGFLNGQPASSSFNITFNIT